MAVFRYFLSFEVYKKKKSICVGDSMVELNHKIDTLEILNKVKSQIETDIQQRFKKEYKNLFVHVLSLTYLGKGD
jgi:hypothetical protein